MEQSRLFDLRPVLCGGVRYLAPWRSCPRCGQLPYMNGSRQTRPSDCPGSLGFEFDPCLDPSIAGRFLPPWAADLFRPL